MSDVIVVESAPDQVIVNGGVAEIIEVSGPPGETGPIGPSGAPIVWRPGVSASSGNVYKTWAEVALAALAIDGPKSIFVDLAGAPGDGNAHVPVNPAGGVPWDLGPFTEIFGDVIQSNFPSFPGIYFEPGAKLNFWPDFSRITIYTHNTAPIYEFTSGTGTFVFNIGEYASFETHGTAPVIQDDGTGLVQVYASTFGGASNFDEDPSRLFIQTGGELQVYVADDAFFGNNTLRSSVISGSDRTFAVRVGSSGIIQTTQPGPGPLVLAYDSKADYISYDDTLVSPPIGATRVQAAIDLLKSGSTISVADVTALSALSITGMKTGTFAYVRSLKSYFVLDLVSSLGTQVAVILTTAAGGNTRWIRDASFCHPAFRTGNLTWFINSSTGNDEADGQTSGTPLKTWGELARRWGQFNRIGGNVSVTIQTSLPSSDPVTAQIVLEDSATMVVQTPSSSWINTGNGTFTDSQDSDPSTNTPRFVQDAIINWATHLNQRVRVTSGGDVGVTAWVVKNLGSNKARLSNPAICDQGFNPVVLSIGDPFVVESLPTVYLGVMDVICDGPRPTLTFKDLDFNSVGPSAGVRFSGGTAYYDQCSFQTNLLLAEQLGVYDGCLFKSGVTLYGGNVQILGGAATSNSSVVSLKMDTVSGGRPGGAVDIDGDFYISGTGLVVGRAIKCEIVSLSMFDSAGSPFEIDEGAIVGFTGGGAIYGSNPNGVGILIQSGASLLIESGSQVTLTASSGDFALSGQVSGRAWNELTAAYTTTRTTTWVHLFQSVAAGGFGGNARNLSTNAVVISY